MKAESEYPSDLSDRQWQIIRRLLPKWSGWGRRPICRRRVINAILYVVRTGCQWRQLPHDFPPLENGLQYFLELAKRRDMGADSR